MLVKTSNHRYLWFDECSDGKKALGSFDLFDCSQDGNDRLDLWSFGVLGRENYGKGYGQRMLKEIIALADGRPIRLCVQKNNVVAIHVYEKVGFRIVGKYMGDEAWVMQHEGGIAQQKAIDNDKKKEAAVC